MPPLPADPIDTPPPSLGPTAVEVEESGSVSPL